MTPAREAIARKIRALRERTTSNGCTEAEALQAAEIMQRLMAEHNLTLDEAEVRRDGIETRSTKAKRRGHGWSPAIWLNASISACTGARAIRRTDTGEVMFIGSRADVEWAEWLFATLSHALDTAEVWWALEAWPLPTEAQRESFAKGMVDRLKERLKAMMPSQAQATPTGTSLVVLKGTMITQWLASNGWSVTPSRLDGLRGSDADARSAGASAGERVGLGRPLQGTGAMLRIGGRS